MMRGDDEKEEDEQPKKQPNEKPLQPPHDKKPKVEVKKDIQLPTKTTFELYLDEGKYRECIIECTKSVEAELRVRMGLFDEKLTLGMLLEKGMQKGMDVLKEFKYVNILLNRVEHENYRPKQAEAQKAVEITTKILLS